MNYTRRGRKAWETRVAFAQDVENFAFVMASKKWQFGSDVTRRMIIEKESNGRKTIMGFSQAYVELNRFYNKAYTNISEFGLSDMLAGTLFQKATICTPHGSYKLREVNQ